MEYLTARLTIPTHGDPVPLLELNEVLDRFQLYYSMAADIAQSGGVAGGLDETAEDVIGSVAAASAIALTRAGMLDHRDIIPESDALQIVDIKRNNPIELVVLGVAVPLACAVILSGGKLQVGPFLKVELPPIGVGIAQLRLALSKTLESRADPSWSPQLSKPQQKPRVSRQRKKAG